MEAAPHPPKSAPVEAYPLPTLHSALQGGQTPGLCLFSFKSSEDPPPLQLPPLESPRMIIGGTPRPKPSDIPLKIRKPDNLKPVKIIKIPQKQNVKRGVVNSYYLL